MAQESQTNTTTTSKAVKAADEAATAGGSSLALNVFAENLLIEKGAYRLDAQTVGIMKQELVERLVLLVNKVSLAALSDEQLREFNNLLDKKAGAEKLQQFVADNVPDIKQRLTEAFYRFRLTYLGTQ